MSRLRAFATVLFSVVAINSCQTYTSGLQQSVVRAKEMVAIATIRTIRIAETSYNITHEGEYGTVQQLVDAGLLDSRYAADKPLKDYAITLKVNPKAEGAASFSCNLDPEKNGEHTGRHFYVDSTTDGIHVNESQPATATDKLLE